MNDVEPYDTELEILDDGTPVLYALPDNPNDRPPETDKPLRGRSKDYV